MSYAHIENLYKSQDILLFKECYALEKIHGTSTHISWNAKEQKVGFFAGGESHEKFLKVFDIESLTKNFAEVFPLSNVIIYGEGYGGKQQGMSATYGKELKFIAFDVKVDGLWLNTPNAEDVCKKLNLDFVHYEKISTSPKGFFGLLKTILEFLTRGKYTINVSMLHLLNAERDRESVQAIRNGCGKGKKREGVVLRPPIELTKNNGERLCAKHKGDEFGETKTAKKVVSPEQMKVLEDAQAIADEWATEMRLLHILDKLPQGIGLESTKLVIDAMVEDVYREAKGEIVESKEVQKFIGSRAAFLFKKKLQKDLEENNK